MISSFKLKLLSLQRTVSPLRLIEQDLRGAISRIKKDEYSREIAEEDNLTVLRVIEHRVKTDSRLTEDDRERLFDDIGAAVCRHLECRNHDDYAWIQLGTRDQGNQAQPTMESANYLTQLSRSTNSLAEALPSQRDQNQPKRS